MNGLCLPTECMIGQTEPTIHRLLRERRLAFEPVGISIIVVGCNPSETVSQVNVVLPQCQISPPGGSSRCFVVHTRPLDQSQPREPDL